jgi:hypothetical protein
MKPIALSLAALLIGGCAWIVDPQNAPGTWRPAGVNEHNLRVMAAVPSEIRQGATFAPTDGEAARDGANRLRTDRVRPLPDTGVARITITPNSGQ